MAKQGDGSSRSDGVGKTFVHQKGMKNRSPSATDASTKCKGGSVSAEPTRSSVARTPGTLGPRCA
jgi:hypothetical protein